MSHLTRHQQRHMKSIGVLTPGKKRQYTTKFVPYYAPGTVARMRKELQNAST